MIKIKNKTLVLSGLLLTLLSCNEFYFKNYSKNDKNIKSSEIEVGYLVSNNRPNGLPEASLIVHFKNKKYLNLERIIDIKSYKYGTLEKSNNTSLDKDNNGILYVKSLSGNRKKILEDVKDDTIKIDYMKNNQIETILFYN